MKYLRTFILALSQEFLSRANIFGWFLVSTIPSVLMILVWTAILGARQNIGGFTKGDFIVYYLFTTFGWYIVGGVFAGKIGRSIKSGAFSATLLKPFNSVLNEALQEQAWKAVSFFMCLPIALIILILFRDIIHLHLSFNQGILLIVSLILGGLNFALLEAIVGLSAFWVVEIWSIDHVKQISLILFGGLLVPLTLLPPLVLTVASFLPFKYMFYVPVSILLSKSHSPFLDILSQLIYIAILFGVYKLVWNMGIKKYESVGS